MPKLFTPTIRYILVFLLIVSALFYWHLRIYTHLARIVQESESLNAFSDANVRYTGIYIFDKNDEKYFWVYLSRKEGYPFASGPPVLIFDSAENLVDYTFEVGEDSRFDSDWWSPFYTTKKKIAK
ncbi:hypothetical protein FACS1894170_12970 [Planctomycetales bacterium]|nr:hypothetical protein FACS1894170_12970 [Planctomycetales bacterium]